MSRLGHTGGGTTPRRTSGLKGWAVEPEEKTIEEISRKTVDSHTRIVFVGLGAPKQEFFIERMSEWVMRDGGSGKQKNAFTRSPSNPSLILMSVGGAFDIIAGRTPRAPLILRTIGLEWLWRLALEPWRWRRQVVLLKFLWLVIGEN